MYANERPELTGRINFMFFCQMYFLSPTKFVGRVFWPNSDNIQTVLCNSREFTGFKNKWIMFHFMHTHLDSALAPEFARDLKKIWIAYNICIQWFFFSTGSPFDSFYLHQRARTRKGPIIKGRSKGWTYPTHHQRTNQMRWRSSSKLKNKIYDFGVVTHSCSKFLYNFCFSSYMYACKYEFDYYICLSS